MSEVVDVADPRLEPLLRTLAASVNARILAYLIGARREQPGQGWRFLSQIAQAVSEKPGTVSVAIQKLLPELVEERRDKGRRYFRSRLFGLALHLESVNTEASVQASRENPL